MGGVLREPLLLDQQLQGLKAPPARLDLVAAGLGAGLVEDGTHAQGLQEAAPRNAVGKALDRDGRPDATDVSLASFEAVEGTVMGADEAELGASHEGLRGSGWTLKTGADAGCVLALSSPAFTPSRLPLSLSLPVRLLRRRFGRDFSHQRVEIDSLGHGEISGAVRMKPVLCAEAVGWNRVFALERARSRIGRRALKIDDRVEEAARPDEGVQRFWCFSLAPNSGLPRADVRVAPMTLTAGAPDRSAWTPDVIACSSSFRLAPPCGPRPSSQRTAETPERLRMSRLMRCTAAGPLASGFSAL